MECRSWVNASIVVLLRLDAVVPSGPMSTPETGMPISSCKSDSWEGSEVAFKRCCVLCVLRSAGAMPSPHASKMTRMSDSTNPTLTPEEKLAFFHSTDNVRQATEQHLRADQSRQAVISFVSSLQHSVSRVIQMAYAQGVGIACTAGCSHCCSARVEAMAPEVFLIAKELDGRPAEERQQFVQRLKTHVPAHSEARAWNQRSKCPFLTDDLCAIYAVRPSGCRKAHSQDVEKCRENALEIPQDLGVVVATEALTKGSAEGYARLGFDAAGHELGRAVLLALSDPTAESRWYKGESVFE